MILDITPEVADALTPEGLQLLYKRSRASYYEFNPLPDVPGEFQDTTSFMESKARFSVLLGGTGSGKTEHAAQKTAKFLLENDPPRERCPFWVVGDTFDQVCGGAWAEKLSSIIPQDFIHSYDWYKTKRNWPYAVFLRDRRDPRKVGWTIEFKSYKQGIAGMKSISIGGYWCNEEVPYPIVLEIQGRCRDYDSPGWADFTPIEVVSPEWPQMYEEPPPGWEFFHANIEHNTYLAPGFAQWYLSQIPEDLRDTRRVGVFATFKGQVYKEWRNKLHIVPPFTIPKHWRRLRGIDFGYNNPFCCLWLAQDPASSRWYVYREHYQSGQLNAWHAERLHAVGKYDNGPWRLGAPYYGPNYSDHDAQQRAELAMLGIPCTPAQKVDIMAGIAYVRSLMMTAPDGKPWLQVFDTCTNLIREVPRYRYPRGTETKNPADLPLGVDDHALDALRYALYSDHQMRQKNAPQPQKPRAPVGWRHGVPGHFAGTSIEKIIAERGASGNGNGHRR